MSVMFGFEKNQTPIHKLNGASKILVVLAVAITSMISFDIRYLLGATVLSFALLFVAKVRFSQVKVIVILTSILMFSNLLLIFLFAPEYGTELFHSRDVLFPIYGRYVVTKQQLLYEACIMIKHMILMPLAIVLVVTTQPSEFAASLNQIGLSYKVSYAVSLTIRYIPDILREYRDISKSQQARGVEMSGKASLFKRLKAAASILTPLILSSMERIEVISNAMELRGFGKNKKRTWYRYRSFKTPDVLAALFALCIIALTVFLFISNGGRYWNPFV